MAELLWAVTCEDVLLDAVTDQVSYIKVFESVRPTKFPFKFRDDYVAAIWRRNREGEEIQIRMTILKPNSDEIVTTDEGSFEFNQSRWWRTQFRLDGLVIEEAGTLRFRIEQLIEGEWSEAGSVPLEILEPEGERDETEENVPDDLA